MIDISFIKLFIYTIGVTLWGIIIGMAIARQWLWKEEIEIDDQHNE